MAPFNPHLFPSPCYAIDEFLLEKNLEILADIKRRSGARILLALKGFAMHRVFPLVGQYLDGICASGLWEAQLGRDSMNKEVHTYAPAFRDDEMQTIAELSNHVVFNSFGQLEKFRAIVSAHQHRCSFGLRVNPECSEVEVDLYNPCAPRSRLGILKSEFPEKNLADITGLHFHTLCEQNADNLERVLAAFEERFAYLLPQMKWVNFGGGHHITRADYKRDLLVDLICRFKEKHTVEVYLEPGEAIALNTGVLIATVLDVVQNDMDIAILDISCTCHMPDVLEMPYRPVVRGAGAASEKSHTYRLGGISCLAGDVVGDYSFDAPLQVGDRLIFEDMAHYTMVKTTMFNGVRHPAIALYRSDSDHIEIVRQFHYEDYRNRLS